MWFQKTLTLAAQRRGCHLVTREVLQGLPELAEVKVGLLHLFIQHTSASLTINENADPDVRGDLERHLNVMVPENAPYYEHTLEGRSYSGFGEKCVSTELREANPIFQGPFATRFS